MGWTRLLRGAVALATTTVIVTACDPPATVFFAVDSVLDAVDVSPGDGACATAVGTCTLRAAIGEANAAAEVADITLASGATYVVSVGGVEDANVSGDLDLTVSATIHGNGSTVDGNLLDRVFQTHGGSTRLTAEDLTIRGGRTTFDGGGVKGTVTLVRGTITGNEADGYIRCADGVGCTTVNGVGGGGVSGTLVAIDSTISDNTSTNGFFGCTITPPMIPTCQVSGGGAVVGSAELRNSTLSGNVAASGMGHSVFGSITVVSSTVVDDQPTGTVFAGSARFLGALAHGSQLDCAAIPTTGFVTLLPEFPDDNGTFTSLGHNRATPDPGSGTGCGFVQATDQAGVAGVLGPLADNGGPTETHLPAVTGPGVGAIPVGSTGLCDASAVADQRGGLRPSGSGCDVGSVERQPTDP